MMKRNWTGKVLRRLLVVVLLGVLASGSLACNVTEKRATLKDPFTMSTGYCTLEGYTRGFEPGQTYQFNLTLRNNTQEPWQSQYYAYLVDSQGVVLNIAQQPVNLGPQSAIGASFSMTLPGEFKEGAYGLALVFPDLGSSITTIRVGDDDSHPAGPWPEPSSLPQS